MASLAEIISQQAAVAEREAAVATEVKRQRAAAAAWEAQQMDADLELALRLSAQEAEAAPDAASGSPVSVPPPEAPVEGEEGGTEVDADLAFALKLQAEEEAAAAQAISAPAGRGKRREQFMRVTPSLLPREAGWRGAEDADEADEEDAALEAQLEEEEEEYASLMGVRGVKDRAVRGLTGWTTKHDARVTGRRNARRLEAKFPEQVGSLSGTGTRLSNRVSGDLSRHFAKRTRKGVSRHARVEAEALATQEGVLDERTRLILFKLTNTVLGQVHGVVKTGKESSVYTATGWTPEGLAALALPEGGVGGEGDGGSVSSTHASSTVLPCTPATAAFPPFSVAPAGADTTVAIKIFRSTLNEFKNRAEYVAGDHRYRRATGARGLSRANPRKVIKLWAEKEWANLTRMWRAGLPCPQPLVLRQHALVMSWLGDAEGFPAPQLREAALPSVRSWATAYTQVVRLMAAMYHRCHLVHADLSEYNLLWHEKRVWVIDTAQAVETSHPNAGDFLARDADNISRFFAKKGVAVLPAEELVAFVTSPATGTDPAVAAVYKTAQRRWGLGAPEALLRGESAAAEPQAGAGEGAEPQRSEYVLGSKHDPVVAALKAAMEGTPLVELGVVPASGEGDEGDPVPAAAAPPAAYVVPQEGSGAAAAPDAVSDAGEGAAAAEA